MEKAQRGILIYGGSFNPVHIGHLRLAIEAREQMKFFLDQIDFVPAACHPQKAGKSLLPFQLRVELINLALEKIPCAFCNELEGKRYGPSYTLDTLLEYGKLKDRKELYFLLGSPDFELLRSWHKGLELADFCNLVIAPRGEFSSADFVNTVESYWHSFTRDPDTEEKLPAGACCLELPNSARLFYLQLPYLEISASRIRAMWLNNMNIEFLMPWRSLELLNREGALARACWLETP